MSSLRTQIIRLAHTHPEFRNDLLPLLKNAGEEEVEEDVVEEKTSKKKASGTAIVRRLAQIIVRIMSTKDLGSDAHEITGKMTVKFGETEILPLLFTAEVSNTEGTWQVAEMTPRRAVSGAGAEILLGFYEAALVGVLQTRGEQLIR